MCKTLRVIDWTKPLVTRDGRRVRYLGRLKGPDLKRNYIVVFISCDGINETYALVNAFGESGYTSIDLSIDIFNAPKVYYANVFKSCNGTGIYISRASTDLKSLEQEAATTRHGRFIKRIEVTIDHETK